MGEGGEQGRFHLVARLGLLGRARDPEKSLSLEREAQEHRASFGHPLARSNSSRDENSGSLDADRNREIDVDSAFRSGKRGGVALSVGELGEVLADLLIGGRSCPRELAAIGSQMDRDVLGDERLLQPARGDAEKRLPIGVGEESFREPGQADEVAPLRLDETKTLAGQR
jgi:hypothetical protein